MLSEGLHHLGHRRFFLAAGDVNAVDVGIFLGQNGVDGHGGLADLTVSDDKFALSTPHRRHGVNSLESGIAWFMYRLTGDNARGHHFNAAEFLNGSAH